MKKKFIVCIDDSTKEQQNILTQFFKNSGDLGYWHYFSDLWLITDPYNTWTAGILRDKIREVLPKAHSLVFDNTDNDQWGGFGNPKMFEWMNTNWDKN